MSLYEKHLNEDFDFDKFWLLNSHTTRVDVLKSLSSLSYCWLIKLQFPIMNVNIRAISFLKVKTFFQASETFVLYFGQL